MDIKDVLIETDTYAQAIGRDCAASYDYNAHEINFYFKSIPFYWIEHRKVSANDIVNWITQDLELFLNAGWVAADKAIGITFVPPSVTYPAPQPQKLLPLKEFGTITLVDPMFTPFPKCECGSDKANQPKHSSWCPKHE